MKQETNNESDLLLRRLSRRQKVSVSDDDSHIDSDHLDADELSSYAENALPAAARARYTEHLADCSKCREIVVQLSASVPVVAARESVTAVQPSWLRNFLASFFSPMVLRYAVPALGLVIVAAIGFAVLRQNSSRDSVAQLGNDRQEAPTAAPAPEPQQPVFSYDSSGQNKSPSSAAATRPEEVDKLRDAAEPPPPVQNAPSSAGGVAPAKTVAPAQKTEDQVAANPAPASAAPAPNPGATVDEMRVEIHGRKANEPAKGDLAKQKAAEADEEQEKRAATVQSAREPSKARTLGTADSAGTGSSGNFSAGQERAKDLEAGVTRTVAGRRFRKQGSQWVDTAYNSGNTVVNIARGSEQYKALVADEPSIKAIADELDGVIIVVWKRSTYRIR